MGSERGILMPSVIYGKISSMSPGDDQSLRPFEWAESRISSLLQRCAINVWLCRKSVWGLGALRQPPEQLSLNCLTSKRLYKRGGGARHLYEYSTRQANLVPRSWYLIMCSVACDKEMTLHLRPRRSWRYCFSISRIMTVHLVGHQL